MKNEPIVGFPYFNIPKSGRQLIVIHVSGQDPKGRDRPPKTKSKKSFRSTYIYVGSYYWKIVCRNYKKKKLKVFKSVCGDLKDLRRFVG